MALKVAIVGLPNVGKSTLFNALTQTASAQAANYPFCTIEPNTGDVAVPEPRLEVLAEGVADAKSAEPKRIYFMRRLPADPFAPDFVRAGARADARAAAASWGRRSYASPPDAPAEGADTRTRLAPFSR